MIKVLIQGIHTNHYYKDWYLIDPITCSVTLIKTAGHIILVDTGTLKFREKLLRELKKEKVKPEDVDIIFNTHFHLDHVANNTLFPNAKQYSKYAIFDLKTGAVEIFANRSIYKKKIPKEIEFFRTPGHFHGHMSVLYNYRGKKYIMAGDVIREDVIRGTGVSANGMTQELYESMKKIFKKADVIIPGHGRIIEGKLFDELKSILLTDFPKKHGLKS